MCPGISAQTQASNSAGQDSSSHPALALLVLAGGVLEGGGELFTSLDFLNPVRFWSWCSSSLLLLLQIFLTENTVVGSVCSGLSPDLENRFFGLAVTDTGRSDLLNTGEEELSGPVSLLPASDTAGTNSLVVTASSLF